MGKAIFEEVGALRVFKCCKVTACCSFASSLLRCLTTTPARHTATITCVFIKFCCTQQAVMLQTIMSLAILYSTIDQSARSAWSLCVCSLLLHTCCAAPSDKSKQFFIQCIPLLLLLCLQLVVVAPCKASVDDSFGCFVGWCCSLALTNLLLFLFLYNYSYYSFICLAHM